MGLKGWCGVVLGMTDTQAGGRIHRFRRWLAYKLLPGTREFSVAVAKRRALQELQFAREDADSRLKKEEIGRSRRLVNTRIPVRESWEFDREIHTDS